ncbi:uncharacterized protein LOC133803773 isoform X2 [Humulus lupulus]|nr:uncharacterized protein LOC133803773 isoform X2 [Humulus lupulus]XP_062097874.1 uncharacterized protein LOC133803773 isoform X2 [Humulus lupulus]
MSLKNIVILCDGMWKKNEDSWKWISNGSRSRSSLMMTMMTTMTTTTTKMMMMMMMMMRGKETILMMVLLSDHCNERSHVNSTPSSNATSIDEDVFCVGQYFVDKKELKMKVHMLAIRRNFEFKVKKSNKKLVVLVCVDPNCKWRIRATKTYATSLFVIRKHCNEHTCSLEMRQNHHRQETCSIIGEHLKARYEGVKKGPNPAQIVNEMNKNLGVKCSYWKAWKVRKCAHELIRGSAANSYPKLPSYLYMVQKSNPVTYTRLIVDEEQKFKYLFLSLGVSIRGFRYMRKVIYIDGTHLKNQFGGNLLIAIAQDGNFQIYPLAFGIVDSENDASWN